MKNILGLFALGLFACMAPSASALLSFSAAVGGAPTGVSYVNFDNLALGNAGGVSGNVTVTFLSGDGQVVNGAIPGIAAPPFISNSNGSPFGDATVSGPDTTNYVTAGIGSVEFDFGGPQLYLGLLWGSVDDYNTLEFFDGNTLVGTITGSDITGSPDGDQGVNGTYYVNINSTLAFTRVVATSTDQYTFELDNMAFDEDRQDPVIPEPASIALLGLGLTGLGVIRRKRAIRA